MDALEMVKVDGLELAVRIWHPDAPRTLVAWHGLARHGGDFAALARHLGPRWRVLAPDTPGRGLSSWSPLPQRDYRYARYAELAVALLDRFELARVPWVGTSMGGLLGMRLAAEPATAGRIERLMLNDIGPELEPDGLADIATYFSRPHRFASFSALQAELRDHYAGFGLESDAAWREMALGSARRLPDGGWSFHFDPRIAEQFSHDPPRDLWADWRALRCPLMVIRGADSPLLSRQAVVKMTAAQPGLVTLEAPGCGHAPMLDRVSQTAPLADFLASPPGDPGAA